MATYYTPSAPSVTEGFFVKAEDRVLLGSSAQYGSLDTTTWVYTTYEISIGLESGQGIEIGALTEIGWNYAPSWESVEFANVGKGVVYDLTDEELTVNLTIAEFKPDIIEFALAGGVRYNLADETVFAFGDGCDLVNRPVSIEFTNKACDAPASPNVATGLTGGVVTFYDTICSNGLPWDNMSQNELNSLGLELKGRPVTARTKGQRLGSLYLY
jgi:hypothetical protein